MRAEEQKRNRKKASFIGNCEWSSRILAGVLTLLILISAIAPAGYARAKEQENSENFEIYQANFLYQNPGVRGDLTASMIHRILYQTIKEEGGTAYEAAANVQMLLNDRQFRMKGKEGLYEQVLLEILQLQMIGGDEQRQEKSAIAWQKSLWETIGKGLDWGAEIADEGALRTSLQGAFPKLAKVIQDGLKKRGIEGSEVSQIMGGVNLLIGIGMDAVTFINQLALYLSLAEYRDGTIEFLRIMYREAKDTELRNAINTVIGRLETLDDAQIVEFVEQSGLEREMDVNTVATLLEAGIMKMLGNAGLIVSGTALLTNLTLNSSSIAEYYLLLKAQITVEDSILKALKYTFNSYTGTYEQACTLNQGVQMMYDAYEHGIDISIAYAQEVLDKGLVNLVKNALSSLAGKDAGSKQFKDLAKTWQGIVTAGRTCFETAWLMYEEENEDNPYLEIIENPPALVTGIELSKKQQSLIMAGNGIYFCGAKVVPSDADNKGITYTSSDTSVVRVDEKSGRLTPVGPGIAQITAITNEGGYSVKQDITVFEREGVSVFEEQQEQSFFPALTPTPQKEEKNYREYYEVNRDGVTLNSVITDFWWSDTYRIPAYLDGNPVTEIDLSEWEHRNGGGVKKIILPETMKRISDGSFDGMRVTVTLNDGLEYVGKRALAGCSIAGGGVLPDTIQEIGEEAFVQALSGEYELVLPTSLVTIGDRAFQYNGTLQRITPGGEDMKLQEIGAEVFAGCSGLKWVNLPDTVEVIGDSAFEDTELTLFELPESLKRIGNRAFSGCFIYTLADGSRNHLVIPDGIAEIGAEAFSGCRGLNTVSLPNTIRYIGERAFANCNFLTKVFCRDTTGESGSNRSELADVPAKVDDSAFYGCRNLESLEIPAVTAIMGTDVISNCPSLEALYWPDTLLAVGSQSVMAKGYMGDHTDFGDLRVYVKPGIPASEAEKAKIADVGVLPDKVFFYEVSAREPEKDEKTGNMVRTSNLRYLEIPAAFGKNFRMDAFYYGVHIPEIVVMGPVENVVVGEIKKEFSQFVYETFSCLDEEGNRVILYQRPDPSPYTKRSMAESENAADYAITIAKETTPITEQTVLGRSVRVNGDAAAVAGLSGRELTVFGWQEQDAANRIWELEEFLSFEDLYLQQKWSYYFRIGAQTEEGYEYSIPGEYQIVFSLPSAWKAEKTAVYHIGANGLITRLSGEYRKNGSVLEFAALADDIGSFAIVHLDTMSERVESSWIEELHVRYDSASGPEQNEDGDSSGSFQGGALDSQNQGGSQSGSSGNQSSGGSSGNSNSGLKGAKKYYLENTTVTVAVVERDTKKSDSEKETAEPLIRIPGEENAIVEVLSDSIQELELDILEIITYAQDEEIRVTAEGENADGTPVLFRYKEKKGEISFDEVKVKKDKKSGGYSAKLKEEGRYYLVFGAETEEGGMPVWLMVILLVGILLVLIIIIRNAGRRRRRRRRRKGRR